MLVLARRLNESITIGNEIKITIFEFDGRNIRLGIEAPGNIPIMRSELLAPTKPIGQLLGTEPLGD